MVNFVKSVSDIFTKQVFCIPDYQRGYSWEEKQWNDLLEDLDLLLEGRKHFTGTIILLKSSNNKKELKDNKLISYAMFDIIDGQQRLATFVILLKCIFDQMKSIPEFKNFSEGLRENYLYSIDLNKQPFTKLVLNEDSHEFFIDHILDLHKGIPGPSIRSHERLLKAKRHFTNYLDSKREEKGKSFEEWLKSLYLKIIDDLTMIDYRVEDEYDAGVIFETMNDRGKDLTELEMVKNYLLYLSSNLVLETDHDLRKRINKTWKHIYESLMAAGLGARNFEDQLLRAHWLMAYNRNLRQWDDNRSIKGHFNLRKYQGRHPELLEHLKNYLSSLKDASTAYCDIHKPKRMKAFNDIEDLEQRRKIVIWSDKLARLGNLATFLPLLMAVRLKKGLNSQLYLETVKLCEKFGFRVYRWPKGYSNTGQSRFFRLGNQFFHGLDPDKLKEDLVRAILDYCTDARFEERFSRKTEDWYHWKGTNYFLLEYEHFLAGGRPVQMSWETLNVRPKADSIEHILPQTPDHPYWLERFSLEQRERWMHDIGNLSLTFDNSRMSNKAFPEKRGAAGEIGCYVGSPLFIERKLATYDDWTVGSIVDRRDKIKKWAINRWHVDAPLPLPVKKEPNIEQMIELAELNNVGEELEDIHNAATKLKLNARVRKRIQYRPHFGGNLSVMTVEVHQNGFRIIFRLHNFAKYRSVSREQVDELFQYKNNAGSWIDAEDVPELVESLEELYELVKDELARV